MWIPSSAEESGRVAHMAGDAQRTDADSDRTIVGQPIGLANLFGIELWERFAFYGMLTILGYYLYHSVSVGGLGLPKSTATGIVGAYGGLVYLCTVLGSWVSDRLLGMERTVFYGGVAVMVGHVALAILPGLAGVAVGLVCIAVGSGALKSNAASLLGTLYRQGDPRRDGGFTLFYLGVNLGAFIGPLVTGLLQTRLGFRYGFGAAALAMSIGLVQYAMFRRNLGAHGRNVPNPLSRGGIWRVTGIAVLVVSLVVAAFESRLLTLGNLSQSVTGLTLIAAAVYFVVMLRSPRVDSAERNRVRAFIPLFLANTVFCALFQQISTVLAIYADERVNRSIFGWVAPPEWIGSIEPVWVILLSPLFAVMWTRLGRRAPTTPVKFALGVIGIGIAFLLFLTAAGTSGQSVQAVLLVAILAVFAVSELLIAPTGLAVTTQLAPEAFRAQMMALYFLSIGLGTAMSGFLARYYDPDRELAYFGTLGGVAIAVGAVAIFLAPRLTRLMSGVH
jgi:proton-dependent oligopeptide transporter, POT family